MERPHRDERPLAGALRTGTARAVAAVVVLGALVFVPTACGGSSGHGSTTSTTRAPGY